MRVAAAILAAGQGSRFGADKTRLLLGGKPLWKWSFDTFSVHPEVDEVLLVGSEENVAELAEAGRAVLGGQSRQESSRIAVEETSGADIVLIHDAARPFVSPELITRVLDGIREVGAAAPGLSVVDTIRELGPEPRLLDRGNLRAMQTPQGARRHFLVQAFGQAQSEFTDEIGILVSQGVPFKIVEGEANNFKVTQPEDYQRARGLVGSGATRTGLGYDVHSFSNDPSRPCILGGVTFDDAPGLDGHSDADVLLHAVTDALLGALALGDIGQHFPNTDPRWKDAPSSHFLMHAADLVRKGGYEIVNVDATIIAEMPKVMRKSDEMRKAMADAMSLMPDQVSVKATTNERLGSIGRGEGVAAFAVATLSRL